jgi:ssDNA-binding Zn-finger/Zn-ribbon topoisomerase 1
MTDFDPQPHIRCLKCGKNLPVCKCGSFQRPYLETSWRLVWLRDKYPPDSISLETEIVAWEPAITFKATATFTGGVVVTAFGSATPKPGQVYSGREVEKAETAAIGRLCARLGFGTQFTGEDDTEHLADAPMTKEPVEEHADVPCPKCGADMKWREDTNKEGRDYRGWFCDNGTLQDKHPPVNFEWVGDKPSRKLASPTTATARAIPPYTAQIDLLTRLLNEVDEGIALLKAEKYDLEVGYRQTPEGETEMFISGHHLTNESAKTLSDELIAETKKV